MYIKSYSKNGKFISNLCYRIIILFVGPAYYSLDPYLAELALNVNPLPLAQYCVSDHFPVLADVPIVPMLKED